MLSYLQSFTGDVLFCTDNKYIRIGRIVIRCICTAGLYTCVILMFYCLLTQSKTANAKNIQRAWRRRVHYLKCVVLIQSIFRTYPERQTFTWKRRCCVQIQSVYRGRSRRLKSL